jgi:hypothetical protein
VAVSGDNAFIADGDNGLVIADIEDQPPAAVGHLDTPGSASGVDVWGDHAYVADGGMGLRVIDISDLASPAYVDHYDTPGNAYDVTVCGEYAYVADGAGGLQRIDISNPANPRHVDDCPVSGIARDVAVAGEYAFVVDEDGLRVIKIYNATTPPVYVGSAPVNDWSFGVAVSGDYAYLVNGNSGLGVMDISDPVHPTVVFELDPVGYDFHDIAISGNYAYVIYRHGDPEEYSYFGAFDISDPLNPVFTEGCLLGSDWITDMAVMGDHAYVPHQEYGLVTVDISEPTNPSVVGSCDFAYGGTGTAASGNYAYVVGHDGGLRVVDVLNPSTPTIVGAEWTEDSQPLYDVAVSGDYAYVVGEGGSSVFDISDPTQPDWVAGLIHGHMTTIAVSGDYAFVGGYLPELYVVDISDPAQPEPYYQDAGQTHGDSYEIAVAGGYVYVAEQSGFEVFEVFHSKYDLVSNLAISTAIDLGVFFEAVSLNTDQMGTINWSICGCNPCSSWWRDVVPGGGWMPLGCDVAPAHFLKWKAELVYDEYGVNPYCGGLTLGYSEIGRDFIRGDDDGDGEHTISDPILSLCGQFAGCDLPCHEASDVDDDGEITIADPIRNLCTQFGDCGALPEPSPGCGRDETFDALSCDCHAACMGCGGKQSVALLGAEVIGAGEFGAGESAVEVQVWVGDGERLGSGRVAYPLYVETTAPLWGFESTVSFPAGALRYEGLVTEGMVSEGHRYVSANEGNVDQGLLRLADVVSFDLIGALEPGVHEVLRLEFEVGGGAEVAVEGEAQAVPAIEVVDGKYVAEGMVSGEAGVSGTAGVVPGWSEGGEALELVPLRAAPNPSGSATSIEYSVPAGGHVSVVIYDVSGQCVRSLVDGRAVAGRGEVVWDGRDSAGREVAGGIYFCRLVTPTSKEMLKVILLK